MLRGVQAHLQDPPTAAVKDPVLVGRKILVVEDNEVSRRILAGILKKQELVVTAVDSGEAAIAAYEGSRAGWLPTLAASAPATA